MLLKFISICLSFLVICDANRCSYVTVPVCGNDVTISPGSLGAPRGDKGDQGQLGPRGITGSRGSKGEKGEVGSSDERALNKIWAKVRELEETVASLSSAIRSTTSSNGTTTLRGGERTLLSGNLLPASCVDSTSNGTTSLIGGEEAYCEDGWTVFQRRFDGSVDFYRNWNQYKNGFGDFSGEFWLGLERIHELTSGKQCRLRIELSDFSDAHAYAEYSSFSVGNEASNYRLLVAGYSGTAGDSLAWHNGARFSTKNRDHDVDSWRNCASDFHGAWWFVSCRYSHLNGQWSRTSTGGDTQSSMNIVWYHWKGYKPLKATTMKLRCD